MDLTTARLDSYNNIGAVYIEKGDLENALLQYQRALEAFLAAHGQEHLDVANTYNNMANVYDSQGHYERALEYYQKGLDIMIKVVGHDHCSWRTRSII